MTVKRVVLRLISIMPSLNIVSPSFLISQNLITNGYPLDVHPHMNWTSNAYQSLFKGQLDLRNIESIQRNKRMNDTSFSVVLSGNRRQKLMTYEEYKYILENIAPKVKGMAEDSRVQVKLQES